MLDRIASPALRVFAIWEPILQTDTEQTARRATVLLDDPRVDHYWTATTDVGTAFQPAIGLATEPAWDVYLLYDGRTEWVDRPPKPRVFMHQLAGRLPDASLLDAEKLAGHIRDLLQGQ